ncbi:LysE family translocator [Undibacterium sp. Ji67W]|uniref:LysE family translocator n=1 Tax=Undibacterium sp. Ji67W TaxID=3413042 RepID=UPI003BF2923B
MSHYFLLAVISYLVATASPGPSNMALMAVAMNQGRQAAFAMACGIVAGSLFWGAMAVLGFATLLNTYAQLLTLLKLFGAAYLLWLAVKAWHTAFAGRLASPTCLSERTALKKHFHRGLQLHLSNPKAIFAWLAIVTLASQGASGWRDSVCLLVVCVGIGAMVFGSYALAFSFSAVRMWYQRWQRWLNAILGAVFASAAGRLWCSD